MNWKLTKRTIPKYPTIFVFILLSILICPFTLRADNQHDVVVKKVVDGDTLRVIYNGEEEKVRLIGIDAPESRGSPRAKKQSESEAKDLQTIVSMGKEATNFVRGLVKPGDRVWIEFDVERRDRYKRLLGYVFLSDGRMLNEEIVRAGYANLLTYPLNVKYQERFLRAYKEARDCRRGLWR